MQYIRQFDSIRAIAVMLVIVSHWIPKLSILPWGEIGVDIFFVLSGFLISGILLENRRVHEEQNANRFGLLKNFIIRRTLRIFPVYYLMVLIHYLLAEDTGTSVKQDIFHVDLIIKFALLILLAWISWNVIEKPFQDLKNKFAYPKKQLSSVPVTTINEQ